MRAPPAHKSGTAGQIVNRGTAKPSPLGHDARLPRRLKKAAGLLPANPAKGEGDK